MKLSVIIPTYRRPRILLQAVRSLQEQTLSDFDLLVVDNSVDSEIEMAIAEFNRIVRVPPKYVPEPQLGLHNARHAGARSANGEILVFTDDDATFDPGWLQAYAEAFEAHPEMVAAGGPVRPVWEAPPPKWLLDYMNNDKTFGIMSLMEPYQEFRLDAKGFFFGVNMAIRRDVLFQVGGFNPELVGRLTIGDGESGLVRKIQDRDWLIGYVPGALVHHHISPDRMTLDYLCRWQSHLAATRLYRRYHKRMPGPFGLAKDGLQTVLSFGKNWVPARVMRFRTDRHAVSLQMQATLRRAELCYIMRLIFDRDFRQMVTHKDWLNPNPATLESQP